MCLDTFSSTVPMRNVLCGTSQTNLGFAEFENGLVTVKTSVRFS